MLRGHKDDAGEPEAIEAHWCFLVQLKISNVIEDIDVSDTICTVLPGNIACKVG